MTAYKTTTINKHSKR